MYMSPLLTTGRKYVSISSRSIGRSSADCRMASAKNAMMTSTETASTLRG